MLMTPAMLGVVDDKFRFFESRSFMLSGPCLWNVKPSLDFSFGILLLLRHFLQLTLAIRVECSCSSSSVHAFASMDKCLCKHGQLIFQAWTNTYFCSLRMEAQALRLMYSLAALLNGYGMWIQVWLLYLFLCFQQRAYISVNVAHDKMCNLLSL